MIHNVIKFGRLYINHTLLVTSVPYGKVKRGECDIYLFIVQSLNGNLLLDAFERLRFLHLLHLFIDSFYKLGKFVFVC